MSDRLSVVSIDLVGEVGLSWMPVNLGTSEVFEAENLLCSGEAASSEFNLTSSAVVDLPPGVCGRSPSGSDPMDCRFDERCSSTSSSSAISINRRLRELVEDAVDPDAACNEQAAESFVSFNSAAVEIS